LRWAALRSEATPGAVTRSGNPFASGTFRQFDWFFRCCAALECVSRFVWRKNDGANFFLPYRCAIDAMASSYVRVSLVFVLTLSGFRKIVGTQRQKNDAHPLGENA
jgi:hypothetical protein